MKLKEWARLNSLHWNTAYRYFHLGLIPGAIQLPTGTIIVQDPIIIKEDDGFIATITSFCCKKFGAEKGIEKSKEILKIIQN